MKLQGHLPEYHQTLPNGRMDFNKAKRLKLPFESYLLFITVEEFFETGSIMLRHSSPIPRLREAFFGSTVVTKWFETLWLVLRSKILSQKLGTAGSKHTPGSSIFCGRIVSHLQIYLLLGSKSGTGCRELITSFVAPGSCWKWVGPLNFRAKKNHQIVLVLHSSSSEPVESLAQIKYGRTSTFVRKFDGKLVFAAPEILAFTAADLLSNRNHWLFTLAKYAMSFGLSQIASVPLVQMSFS